MPWKTFILLLIFPSLALSNNPLDALQDAFKISRPFLGTKDSSFYCKLANGETHGTCKFLTPSDKTYVVTNDGSVNDTSTGQLVPNVTAYGKDEHGDTVCGLKFSNFSETDHGWWSCLLEKSGDFFKHFDHVGTFRINRENEWPKDIRLPTDTTVSHYELELIPFLEDNGNFTTDGKVTIHLTTPANLATEHKNKIFLHSKQIIINEESVQVKEATSGGKALNVSGHEYDIDREFYVIHLSQDLTSNMKYDVVIHFTAILNDDLSGFYRSSYTKPSGEKSWLAVTQFETTGARKSFPCLDEPDKKANFTVKLGRRKSMNARSNMRVVSSDDIGNTGYVMDTFEKSVEMSTYLLAFLVSDFVPTENEYDETYKIWSQEAKQPQAAYAASIGPDILEYYEDYFSLDFPLPKMDMAAIPDFSAGAMENWGLITYRERLLLFDDELSSAIDKENVAVVMAHELAHQWFGNIVTMKWWTDLWLNEGFATHVEKIGAMRALPEAKMRDRQLIEDCQMVFGLDALESSKAITVEVTNPDYDAYFGSIAYSKGGCLLRMAENFMTEEKFRQGVNAYLKEYLYGNAETAQLWAKLTEFADLPQGLNVSQIMNTWTTQPGFPVVTINATHMSQTRFLLDPNAEDNESLWKIPISITYPNGEWEPSVVTTPDQWLTGPTAAFKPLEKPYLVNVKATGYYRVNYDDENWNSLITVLKNRGQINKLNRAQLIDDIMNLARGNRVKYDLALNLLTYLKVEDDFHPWESAFGALYYLKYRVVDQDGMALMRKFILDLLESRYSALGFVPQDPFDDHLTILGRRGASQWMCAFDQVECVTQAQDWFNKWMKSNATTKIPADIKDIVFNTGVRQGNQSHWDFVVKQFQITRIDSDRQKFLNALSASENEKILEQLLNMTIHREESGIRLQDCIYVYRSISVNKVGRGLTLQWLSDNYDNVVNSFGDSGSNAGGGQGFARFASAVIDGYATTSNDKQDIIDIDDFVAKHSEVLQGSMTSINDAKKKAQLNIDWNQMHGQAVRDWLKEHYGEDTTSTSTSTPIVSNSTSTTVSSTTTSGSAYFSLEVVPFFLVQLVLFYRLL